MIGEDQFVALEDVMATIEKVGNFGDYTREELTPEFGQPRFDMMNSILQAVFAMPTVQPDIVAPAECNCDDPNCGFNHVPLTLRQAYQNCLSRLKGAEARAEQEYDRGRRDILNAILDLNPKAAQKRHIINGGTQDTFDNHEGKLPFDVVFWVCEIASQLGIEPREEALPKE